MMKKFIIEYRCLGTNYRLELEGNCLNDVLLYFSKTYSDIDKIHFAREKNFSDCISKEDFNNFNKVIKPI